MIHDKFGRVNAPPPDGTPGATCACGAYYLDYPDGHVAHEIVLGHRPRAPDKHEVSEVSEVSANDERK